MVTITHHPDRLLPTEPGAPDIARPLSAVGEVVTL
jgi:hypothetical protein